MCVSLYSFIKELSSWCIQSIVNSKAKKDGITDGTASYWLRVINDKFIAKYEFIQVV